MWLSGFRFLGWFSLPSASRKFSKIRLKFATGFLISLWLFKTIPVTHSQIAINRLLLLRWPLSDPPTYGRHEGGNKQEKLQGLSACVFNSRLDFSYTWIVLTNTVPIHPREGSGGLSLYTPLFVVPFRSWNSCFGTANSVPYNFFCSCYTLWYLLGHVFSASRK